MRGEGVQGSAEFHGEVRRGRGHSFFLDPKSRECDRSEDEDEVTDETRHQRIGQSIANSAAQRGIALAVSDHLDIRRFFFDERINRRVGKTLCAIVRRSEEHTSELQSLMLHSYAVFCLKKKKNQKDNTELTYATT